MATRRQCLKRIKKRPLSERSEFRTLPDFGASGVIGVGNGARRPRPPNRTCGSPAYGSPVGSFHIGIVSLLPSPYARRTDKLVRGRHPAETLCLPGRRYQRRQHPVRPVIRFDPGPTPLWRLCTCLALAGTDDARACVFPSVLPLPSYLPSLSMVLLPTRSVRLASVKSVFLSVLWRF